MARTLLQIVNQAQAELGLPQSSTIIGNSDPTTVQLLAFAQTEVELLNQRHTWTALQTEYNLVVSPPIITTGDVSEDSAIITNIPDTSSLVAEYYTISALGIPVAARILSVDSLSQVTMTMECTGSAVGTPITFSQDTYPEPTDFSRFINKTWYDRTNRWQLVGPDSPQQDQFQRSGIVALGPRRHFRQLGMLSNNYRIWPPPSEIVQPLQLVFEYISRYNVFLAGSRAAPSFTWTNDTDTPILDDRAIIMGIKWRFWAQKGLNYAKMEKDYDDYCDRLAARDGAAPTLGLVRVYSPFLLTSNNVQDSNFPGQGATQ